MPEPITVESDGRTLTIRHLVATADGTEVVYEFPHTNQAPWNEAESESIVLRAAGQRVAASGRTSTSADARRTARRWRLDPLPLTARRVELSLTSALGDWTVPIELEAFGDATDAARSIDAGDRRNGISIRVSHLALTEDATALAVEVSTQDRGAMTKRLFGLGGLLGKRKGPSAFVLRDRSGRVWPERAPLDRVVRDATGVTDVALFDRLPADAKELELVIPFVYVVEDGRVDVDLPISAPIDVMLGTHPVRLLSSDIGVPESAPPGYGPALRVGVDFGQWHHDERILMPARMELDGRDHGIGASGDLNTMDPQPLSVVEALGPAAATARQLSLVGAWIQVRGPWRMRFTLPM